MKKLKKHNSGAPGAWPPPGVLAAASKGFRWQKAIAVDLDNTLRKFSPKLLEYLAQVYPGAVINSHELRYFFSHLDPAVALTPNEINDAFLQFARLTRGGYDVMEPEQVIIAELKKLVKAGVRPCFMTTTPRFTTTMMPQRHPLMSGAPERATLQFIESLKLPNFNPATDLVYCNSAGDKKWAMLDRHIPIALDDSVEVAVGVAMALGAAVIMPHRSDNAALGPTEGIYRLTDDSQLSSVVLHYLLALKERRVLDGEL